MDITKCTQSLCPLGGNCLRRTAASNIYWQSWATFSYNVTSKGVVCENQIPLYDTTTTENTEDN